MKSLDKSQKSWKSWQSWFISTVSTKILTQPSLNWKVSILKISTEKKNNLVSTVRIISTSFKSWSRHKGRSRSRSQLVSTVETPMLTEKIKKHCLEKVFYKNFLSWKRHNHNARTKALISGECLISGKINLECDFFKTLVYYPIFIWNKNLTSA